MCNCGGLITAGTTSFCGSKINRLTKSYNIAVNLFNNARSPEEKEIARDLKDTIDSLITESNATNTCPDLGTVTLIESEVLNEYKKRYNT